MPVNKYDIKERKKAWISFLEGEDQPQYMFMINYDDKNLTRPPLWPDKVQERIEWAYAKYMDHMKQIEWLRDDSLPYLDCLTGTEIFAEAFGCKVHRAEDNMPFALPLIHSASEVSSLKVPSLFESTLAIQFEIADELVKRAGKGTLLKPPDIQSPMDIASLIWDKNDIYTAMIETPEAVKELTAKVCQLLIAFMDEWFRRYGKEFIAHFPDYYMPYGLTLSEDEVGAVSQEMFLEFFLPELEELSQNYGALGMHCCADAKHQWDNFKKIPNLKIINFVHNKEYIKDAYSFFASHVSQIHSWCGDRDPLTWVGKYPPQARVVINAPAATREEALRLSEGLWEICKR